MLKNLSHRHRRAARKLGANTAPETKEYIILDPSHRVDLRGEFAGVKVTRRGNNQLVALSDAAARFYLDSGSIRPLVEGVKQAAVTK